MNLIVEAATVAAGNGPWEMIASIVGSSLVIIIGISIRLGSLQNTRINEKIVALANRFEESLGEVKGKMETMTLELTKISATVSGNPLVEGDRGLAGKVNGHGSDIAELQRKVLDLERGPARGRR